MAEGRERLAVAAAQHDGGEADPARLLDAHFAAIAEARASGVGLLLFPELSLTGYAGAVASWREDRLPGRAVLRRLADVAGPMAVAVGLPEEGPTGLLHNVQVILHGGRIVHRHRKLNLPTYGDLEEGKHFTPGLVVEPFRIGAWRVAVLTCADAWNPALPWLAALAGADLLLVPVASMAGAVAAEFDTPAGWDLILRHTAMTYGLPTLMANYAGGGFWGGSRILGPGGEALAVAGAGIGLIAAELDLAAVRGARRLLPTARDAVPETVLRELERRLRSLRAGMLDADPDRPDQA